MAAYCAATKTAVRAKQPAAKFPDYVATELFPAHLLPCDPASVKVGGVMVTTLAVSPAGGLHPGLLGQRGPGGGAGAGADQRGGLHPGGRGGGAQLPGLGRPRTQLGGQALHQQRAQAAHRLPLLRRQLHQLRRGAGGRAPAPGQWLTPSIVNYM